MENRNEEKSQIASTYTDTVSKLIEVSDVFSKATNHSKRLIITNTRFYGIDLRYEFNVSLITLLMNFSDDE